MLKLPESMREVLKKPMGDLIKDESILQKIISRRSGLLISVGDAISAQLIRTGMRPDLIVVDMRVMRNPASEDIVGSIKSWKAEEIRVRNPAGTLDEELISQLRNPRRGVKIIVDGEEDLAVIPAVIGAPVGSLVVYGQPKEGAVVIKVTEETKDKFLQILREFEKVEE